MVPGWFGPVGPNFLWKIDLLVRGGGGSPDPRLARQGGRGGVPGVGWIGRSIPTSTVKKKGLGVIGELGWEGQGRANEADERAWGARGGVWGSLGSVFEACRSKPIVPGWCSVDFVGPKFLWKIFPLGEEGGSRAGKKPLPRAKNLKKTKKPRL